MGCAIDLASARRCLCVTRPSGPGGDRCPGRGPGRARQRRAGLRDRPEAGRANGVARLPRRCGRPPAGRGARRRRLPRGEARQRLPAEGGRREVRPCAGALDAAGAAERQRLRPGHPRERLRLPADPGRHQARDLRPPAVRRHDGPAGRRPARPPLRRPDADPDRVRRLRLRRSGRAAERDLDPRQPDGLHGRRREHARHRLLWRRLRLLRAAPVARRLRRDRDDRPPALGRRRQGRDDGDLLRRDQPALHGRDEPAEPRCDLADVGDRQHPDDALSGRDPQHGIRARVGQGADPRRAARVARRRPALGLSADPERRRDLQGQPGPPSGGREPAPQGPRERPLQAEGRRPALPGHLRRPDQGADLHGLPVDRRADRRALPDPGFEVHRHQPQVVHVHERHPRRLARPGDLQPLVRLPEALRRQASADQQLRRDPGRRPGHLPGGHGHLRGDAAAGPDPAPADLPGGAAGVRGDEAGPGHVRQRRRPQSRDSRSPASRSRSRASRRPGPRAGPGSSTATAGSRTAARAAARRAPSTGTRGRPRRRTSAATPPPADSGRRSRTISGSSGPGEQRFPT